MEGVGKMAQSPHLPPKLASLPEGRSRSRRISRCVCFLNLRRCGSAPLHLPRTPLGAGSMPRRHSWGSSASSTYGTASFVHKKLSTLPTAPRTCPATSYPGWTTTLMCLEGLQSGPWRPVRSVSLTCSCLLLCLGGQGWAVPVGSARPPPPPAKLCKSPCQNGLGPPKLIPRDSWKAEAL